jgi:hypothetical protein
MTPDKLQRRIKATEIVDQFERLDKLGAFVGQEVRDQKILFAMMELHNYATWRAVTEGWLVPEGEKPKCI